MFVVAGMCQRTFSLSAPRIGKLVGRLEREPRIAKVVCHSILRRLPRGSISELEKWMVLISVLIWDSLGGLKTDMSISAGIWMEAR